MTTAALSKTGGGMTAAQIEIIKRQYCKGANDDELALFLATCERTGLDPTMKQIYSLPMRGSRVTIIGIDGFRTLAEKTGHYRGQLGPEFCGDDGIWCDMWKSDKPPTAARVGVVRDDFDQPLYAVAHWRDYARNTETWKSMPCVMIGKVAEALAIRRAFPTQTVGLYERAEMDQATEPRNVTPASPPAPPDKPKRTRKAKAAPPPEPKVVDVETAPADEPGDVVGDPDNDALKARFQKAVTAYNLTQDRVDQQVMSRFSNYAERVDYLRSMVVKHGDPSDVDGVRQRIKDDCHTFLSNVI